MHAHMRKNGVRPTFVESTVRHAIAYMAQNLRKGTLGAKIRKSVLFSKNDLHSPENDTTYFLKLETELF